MQLSNPVFTGAFLIEANGAALNNAGNDAGQRLDNAVAVKQVRVGPKRFPYISGQAVRRWWREVLYEDFDWQPSPVTREAKSAYTEGDPIQYPDDDLFGYMAAKKAQKAKRQKKDDHLSTVEPADQDAEAEVSAYGSSSGTLKRVSPLKNSLLVSVHPDVIASDFGHFSRDLPVDNPNMVPFEHQHYTSTMQGVFTIALQDVGRFECGLMRDLALDTPLPTKGATQVEGDGRSRPRTISLSSEVRRKRVKDVIHALGHLRHGANLARNLSDVAPVVVLLAYLDGGNAPLQNLFIPSIPEHGTDLNVDRLRSVVKDYKDRLLGESRLYFGYLPGILSNETDVLAAFNKEFEGVNFFVGTPGEAIAEAAKAADQIIG